MTDTPISSFLCEYSKKDAVRLHMPGHKGKNTEAERFDITEIEGADSLFHANGIIEESERIASDVFGAHTFYSTEGSSLSIRAMLYLALLHAKREGNAPLIAASRNAHKSFTSAAALIDFRVDWIHSENATYLSSRFTKEDIVRYFEKAEELPLAVYVTSPDYLGFISDIKGIAEECKKRGVLLLVDNAHGAYLKFLTPSLHPIDLGADMCCDSAHKTLSALTGCAYLHISANAPDLLRERAKDAMMLFASTSPSYLLLSSLDRLNPILSGEYPKRLDKFIKKLGKLKESLVNLGFSLSGNEPMKLTIRCKDFGYTGTEVSRYLMEKGIFSEFSDPDYLVLMPSPENSDEELGRLLEALSSLPKKSEVLKKAPPSHIPKKELSIRDAVMADSEILPTDKCIGRVASAVTLGCPPAIPIVVPGEMIDEKALLALKYYGIEECRVVK